MEISEWSDRQLAIVAQRYRAMGKTEGSKFPLAAILREQLERKPTTLDTVAVARAILESSRASPDGMMTYGELWRKFNPDTPWSGHGTQSIVKNSLGRVVGYCVDNQLPILAVLVVPTSTRTLSDQAIDNIFSECRLLGVSTGDSARKFVDDQIEKAKRLSAGDLPD